MDEVDAEVIVRGSAKGTLAPEGDAVAAATTVDRPAGSVAALAGEPPADLLPDRPRRCDRLPGAGDVP